MYSIFHSPLLAYFVCFMDFLHYIRSYLKQFTSSPRLSIFVPTGIWQGLFQIGKGLFALELFLVLREYTWNHSIRHTTEHFRPRIHLSRLWKYSQRIVIYTTYGKVYFKPVVFIFNKALTVEERHEYGKSEKPISPELRDYSSKKNFAPLFEGISKVV